jgi:hypothetical protein
MIRILEALDSNFGRKQTLLNFFVAFLYPRRQSLELCQLSTMYYPIHNEHMALLSSNDIYLIIIEKAPVPTELEAG